MWPRIDGLASVAPPKRRALASAKPCPDHDRVLPLLAFLDDTIIGDGILHHRRVGARQHVGEVRVVVAPAYRNRGVGRGLLHKLIEIAGETGVKKLMFEVVADTEPAARHTAQVLGHTG